jgi:two-component system LytT family response regulator
MRIVIADDDLGMRMVMRKIIDSMDEMECVGEASNGEEAVQLCLELKPDIVILDVDMPIMKGTDAAKVISEVLPNISKVFCTAHADYMPEAFEVYAADYLLKPFKTDRVRQTLRRIQKEKSTIKLSPQKTIVLKNRDGITFLPVKDILMVYRENKVTTLVTSEGNHTTSESLNALWSKLEGGDFFKSHRAYIIYVPAITTVSPYGRWTYCVSLRGTSETALITTDKLEELQEYLN